jgi:hypothetical protein
MRMRIEHWWGLTRENRSTPRKTCPSATLTTNIYIYTQGDQKSLYNWGVQYKKTRKNILNRCTEYIRNVDRAILNTVFENTVRRVSKYSIWRLAGDISNITCNFLYCNHQVRRDVSSLLYKKYRIFHGGKVVMAWCWPPTPSNAEVKERMELYLYPSGPSWPVLWETLPYIHIQLVQTQDTVCFN